MRALFTFLAAALLTGCVSMPDAVWQPVCGGKQACDPAALALEEQFCSVSADGKDVGCGNNARHVGNSYRVKLGYLEYPNEFISGNAPAPRDPLQLQTILKEIDNAKRPLLVSVYVHGWHHNASKDDDNVQNFPHMLTRYAYALQHAGKQDYDVLGIYVGWRGELGKGPANEMTLGNRAEAADHIGQTSMLPVELKRIADALRSVNPQNRMVIMGHSLGGRILTRAFLPSFFAGNTQPLGTGTLIVTTNAAIGADTYRSLYDSKFVSSEAQAPTWVNFTAKDDAETTRIYPLALKSKWIFADEIDEAADTRQTIGNYPPYITHQLSIQKCEPTNNPALSSCGWNSDLDAHARTDYWRVNDYRLFTVKYGQAINPQSASRHCVLLMDYPRSEALQNRIRQENRYLCSDVLGKDDQPITALRKIPAYGRLWNVRVDSSAFDFAEPTNFTDVNLPSGYLQEDLTAMLVQLAFEKGMDITTTTTSGK